MHSRFLRVAAVLVAAYFTLVGASAIAGPPPLSAPKALHTLDFEGSSTGFTSVEAIPMPTDPMPTSAFWGVTALQKHAGTKSLWCGGTLYPSLSPFSGASLTYAQGTRGRAVLALPEMGDMYDAKLSFYYLMPSLGGADENSFSVRWTPTDGSAGSFNEYGFPLASAWTQQVYDVSRHPGNLTFQFYDFAEGPSQTPLVGQGPAIDDVSVTGYKFGPVRNAKADAVASGIQLNWDAPFAAEGGPGLETRPVSYRVWRSLDGQGVWQDLTSGGRLTATSFLDDATSPGAKYDYVIQAMDPGTGDPGGWGAQVQVVQTAGGTKPSATVAIPIAKTVFSTVTNSGYTWGNLDVSGSVTPTHAAGAPVATIEAAFGSTTATPSKWTATAPDGANYKISIRLTKAGTWYVRAVHDDADHAFSASDWRAVKVTSSVILSKPSRPSYARLKKAFSVSGTLMPKHSTTTRPVKIYAYRYVGSKRVQTVYFTPKITSLSSTTTKYYASIALPTKGSWKLRAYHAAHGSEGATWSSYTSAFSVK